MYTLQTESSFDSAHFLANYNGKCRNIHGHRWKVIAEIHSEFLFTDGQHRGMIADFSDFKKDLREQTEKLDHTLIIEENTIRKELFFALMEEGFSVKIMKFRPTAENMARYFYEAMKSLGYHMKAVTVYETPENCASYMED